MSEDCIGTIFKSKYLADTSEYKYLYVSADIWVTDY